MTGIKLSREQKQQLINNVKRYFETERDENLGDLAAENLIEFMLKQLGPIAYNAALSDARLTVMEQMQRLEEEIYSLEQPVVK